MLLSHLKRKKGERGGGGKSGYKTVKMEYGERRRKIVYFNREN